MGNTFRCASVKKYPQFGGSGKLGQHRLEPFSYFSSEDELNDLFNPWFNIKELKTIEVKGKSAAHLAVYAFMEKR